MQGFVPLYLSAALNQPGSIARWKAATPPLANPGLFLCLKQHGWPLIRRGSGLFICGITLLLRALHIRHHAVPVFVGVPGPRDPQREFEQE
jgi:hypothetical protein